MSKKKKKSLLGEKEVKISNEPTKTALSGEFYLGTSIVSFLAALSHIEEARKWLLTNKSEYKIYMIIFIIFLCLSFFLLGIFFGKKSEHSHLSKQDAS